MKKQRLQVNLRNSAGKNIPTDAQAEAMADHLETVQWFARSGCGDFPDAPIFPTQLQTNDGEVTLLELSKIIRQLKNQKAAGSDEIPPELWKAVSKDSQALQHFTNLCNECWRNGYIPKSWHKASVVTIFKKGSLTDMNNYRPISLLQISYKIFAALILQRLKAAEAEENRRLQRG